MKTKKKSKLTTSTKDSLFLIQANGQICITNGQGKILKQHAEASSPTTRDPWSEGNWNTNRPREYVPWDRPEEIIEMCWNAYSWDGIVGNVIDLMTDFSIEGLELQHPNKSVHAFLNSWWSLIKGNKILNEIFHNLFRAGICMIERRTRQLDPSTQRKIVQLSQGQDELLPETTLESREIPYQYFTYDPRSVRIYGDEVVGSSAYYIVLDQNSVDAIYGGDHDKLQSAIKNKTIKRQGFNYEYLLDKSKVTYLAWRKMSYSKYGMTFTTRILESLLIKRKFFNMLRGASDNWLSAIRIWKLGQQKGGPETLIMPSKSQFVELGNAIKSHQPGASMDLLWNFAIELEEHYPPVDKIFSSVPLDLINREIKYGLGVPDVLIDGSGGTFSNGFLAIKTLVERLEYARELVMSEFLMPQLREISDSLGFRRLPTVKWGHMNLRDEGTILKLLLALRDRKLISRESLLKEFDLDKTIEKSRILEDEDDRKSNEEAFDDFGPFFIENNMAGGAKPGVDSSRRGRPDGKSTPNSKRRDSSPTGIKTAADTIITELMHTEAPQKLDDCVSQVKQSLVEKYKKRNGKSPSAKKMKEIESKAWGICRSSLNMTETTQI
jgi:hypothetical protein